MRARRRGLAVAALLAAAGLAACEPSIREVNPAPPGISYRLVGGETMDQLKGRAEQYCAQYGKHASPAGGPG